MTLPWYTTREAVKAALDYNETARNNARVDRAIEAARVSAEGLLNRTFYPQLLTLKWDWPNYQYAWPWTLWLDQHELISLTSLTSGGIAIPAASYLLEPVNDGPPYERIDINLSTSAAFQAGTTYQQAVVAVGLFGYRNDERPAGILAAALTDTTGTTVDTSDASLIGIGQLIRVDTERMVVTGRSQLDTGQTISADLAASSQGVTVGIQTGTAIAVGETILVDSERMLVVDQAGNNLTVRRAFDGSVLAAHTTGAKVYAPRRLVVERGALGTTAATHLNAATVVRWEPPGALEALSVAEAINQSLQETSGYARTVGSGDNVRNASGAGLADLRRSTRTALGRQVRTRAV